MGKIMLDQDFLVTPASIASYCIQIQVCHALLWFLYVAIGKRMFGRSQQLFLDRYHSLNWQRELCELNWQTECMVIHFTPSPFPPPPHLPPKKHHWMDILLFLDGFVLSTYSWGGGGGGGERVVNSSLVFSSLGKTNFNYDFFPRFDIPNFYCTHTLPTFIHNYKCHNGSNFIFQCIPSPCPSHDLDTPLVLAQSFALGLTYIPCLGLH